MSRFNYKKRRLKEDESYKQHLIRFQIMSTQMKKYLEEHPPEIFPRNFL